MTDPNQPRFPTPPFPAIKGLPVSSSRAAGRPAITGAQRGASGVFQVFGGTDGVRQMEALPRHITGLLTPSPSFTSRRGDITATVPEEAQMLLDLQRERIFEADPRRMVQHFDDPVYGPADSDQEVYKRGDSSRCERYMSTPSDQLVYRGTNSGVVGQRRPVVDTSYQQQHSAQQEMRQQKSDNTSNKEERTWSSHTLLTETGNNIPGKRQHDCNSPAFSAVSSLSDTLQGAIEGIDRKIANVSLKRQELAQKLTFLQEQQGRNLRSPTVVSPARVVSPTNVEHRPTSSGSTKSTSRDMSPSQSSRHNGEPVQREERLHSVKVSSPVVHDRQQSPVSGTKRASHYSVLYDNHGRPVMFQDDQMHSVHGVHPEERAPVAREEVRRRRRPEEDVEEETSTTRRENKYSEESERTPKVTSRRDVMSHRQQERTQPSIIRRPSVEKDWTLQKQRSSSKKLKHISRQTPSSTMELVHHRATHTSSSDEDTENERHITSVKRHRSSKDREHKKSQEQPMDSKSGKKGNKLIHKSVHTSNVSVSCDRSPPSPDSSDDDSVDDKKKRHHRRPCDKSGRSARHTEKDVGKNYKSPAERPKNKSSRPSKRTVRTSSSSETDSSNSENDDDPPDRRDSASRRHSGSCRHNEKVSKKPSHNGKKDIKPNKFNGHGACVETFLAQFEICAQHNDWTVIEKTAQLKCCLVEEAGRLIWDSGRAEEITYTELVEKLRRRYGFLDQQEKFEAELRARKRGKDETLAELYQDIRYMMIKAYPGEGSTSLYERVAIDHFLKALRDEHMASKIREREPKDLDAAFKHALRLEAQAKASTEIRPVVEPSPQPKAVENVPQVNYDAPRQRYRRDEGLARRVTELEHKAAALVTDSYRPSPPPQQQNTEVEEMRRKMNEMSKEIGRLQALQPQRQVNPGERPPQVGTYTRSDPAPCQPSPSTQRDRAEIQCYNCRGFGHIASRCTNPRRTDGQGNRPATRNGPTGEAIVGETKGTSAPDEVKPERKTYLQLVVNGIHRKVLLDTGSDATLLPSFAVLGVPVESCSQRLLAANGTSIRVNGKATVEAYMGQHKFKIVGLVTDHVAEVMLGIDFLRDHGAVWDFRRGEIELDDFVHRLCSREPSNWCRRVILQTDYIVPARSEVDLPTKVVYNDLTDVRHEGKQQWITETHALPCGLQVARTVLPDSDVNVPIRVMNVKQEPVTLQVGAVISNIEAVEVCEGSSEDNNTSSEGEDPLLAEMVSRVDESVSEGDRHRLMELLGEYSTTFSRGENDLGRTDIVTHYIDTGDNRPVRQALRRHPPAHQEAIRQHVSTMLEQGVIETARSPWASNVVLVRKKDGSLRCCIDYRQVNALTRKDAYPLPRTDVCLDAMAGSSWFSTFDLRSSYHQVKVDSTSTDATAFICREGQFRFRTMPFGLCNAGATFQRLMDIVMSGLTFEVCLTYLDDVIVFSPTIDVQFERLRLVLERLHQAGLKLKSSKCNLLQRSVKFLGHVVSAGKIGVDPEKVSHVVEWPVPVTLKEVRGFVGLCSYYRRFIRDFGKIASPLNAMSEKNRTFSWTEDCQEAFSTLKKLLTSAPLLAMPNESDKFVLDTDASLCSIGAVLSQIQNDEERPVAYASRKLSKAEMNYCVTRRELLAVVYFLKYFRHYLLGRKFTVRTDHAALQWLRHTPDPIGQQARWIGFMEMFDMDIVYRPGVRHGNADQMSRKPCRMKDCFCSQRATRSAAETVGEDRSVLSVRQEVDGQTSPHAHQCSQEAVNLEVGISELSVMSVVEGSGGTEAKGSAGEIGCSRRAPEEEDVMNSQDATRQIGLLRRQDVCSKTAICDSANVGEAAVTNWESDTSVKQEVRRDTRYVCEGIERQSSVIEDTNMCVKKTKSVDGYRDVDNAGEETVRVVDTVTGEDPDWSTEDEVDDVEVINLHTSCSAIKATSAPQTAKCAVEGLTRDVILREQEADEDIRLILQLKKQSDVRPAWDDISSISPKAKALWNQWVRLSVHNEVLYRRFEYLDGRSSVWQLVVPYRLRRQIFSAVHGGMTGGHLGRKRTELQLQRRAYWPGWTSDVRRFIRMCEPCQRYHRGAPPKISTLKTFGAGDVWERISIDITGPHPRSRHGNVYLLTVMDHFSKWSDAFPIANHTAITVAKVLFNRVFAYFGAPLQLLSDQGPEFESALFQEMCRWMDIQKLRTTPYKASTNGMVERYHRTLNSILAKIIADDQRDWCQQAPVAAAAYRASVHEATGYSPNFVVFGRENRAPIDLILDCPPGEEDTYASIDQYVEERQTMMRDVFSTVREHLGAAACRRKDYYDTKVKESIFHEGVWVWYLYPRRRVGMSPKWQKFYTGPYLIVRVLPPNDLVIQKSKRSKSFVVHKDKLKLFQGDAPPSWLRTSPESAEEHQQRSQTSDVIENVNPTTENPAMSYGLQQKNTDTTSHDALPDVADTALAEELVDVELAEELTGEEQQICNGTPSFEDRPRDSSSVDPPSPQPAGRPARARHKPSYLKDFVCAVCRSVMSDQKWDKPRRCPVEGCGRLLSRSNSLKRHMKRAHGSAPDEHRSTSSTKRHGREGVAAEPTHPPPDKGRQSPRTTEVHSSRPRHPIRESHALRSAAEEPSDRSFALRLPKASDRRVVTALHEGGKRPVLPPVTATTADIPGISSIVAGVADRDVITDDQFFYAGSLIYAAGPAATIPMLVRELSEPPLNFPMELARGLVIVARMMACNVASLKKSEELHKTRSRPTVFETTRAAIRKWARDPFELISTSPCRRERTASASSDDISADKRQNIHGRRHQSTPPASKAKKLDMEEIYSTTGETSEEDQVTESEKEGGKEKESTTDGDSSDGGSDGDGDVSLAGDTGGESEEEHDKERGKEAAKEDQFTQGDTSVLEKTVSAEAPRMSVDELQKQLEQTQSTLRHIMKTTGAAKPKKKEKSFSLQLRGSDGVDSIEEGLFLSGQPDMEFLQTPPPASPVKSRNEKPKMSSKPGSSQVPSADERVETVRSSSEKRKHTFKSGDKSDWRLKVDSTTKVLIIGDSNLTNVKEVPEGWSLNAFSGAKFRHVGLMVNALTPEDVERLECVYVQVGINHREDKDPRSEVDEMLSVFAKRRLTVVCVGVPKPPALSPLVHENIDRINNHLRRACGEYFIPAIPDDKVVVIPTDLRYRIHHGRQTIDAVIRSMLRHWQQFSGRSAENPGANIGKKA